MTCRDKILLVVHIFEKDEMELKVSQKFCNSEFPVPYRLIYVPIKLGTHIDREMISVVSGECNFTLIYQESPRIGPLMELLAQIKKFHHTTIYAYSEISNYFIEKNNITGIETYKLEPKSKRHIEVLHRSSYKSIIFPQKEIKTNRLECQVWFEIYINKAFGCGFGKLFQLSGTCFLNSAICGLFLSDTRLYLIDVFNRLSSVETFRSKIENELDPLVCPTFDYSTSKWYIFTLINVIFCRGSRPQKHALAKSTDYLSLAKSLYEEEADTGSSSTFTVLKILNECMASCVLKIDNNIVDLPYFSLNYKNFYSSIETGRYEPIKTHTSLPNFVLEYYSTFPVTVLTEKRIGFKSYTLQCGFITISRLKDHEQGHGVVGFFCENVPKVYDPSSNKVLNIDWRNLVANDGGNKLLSLLDRDPEAFDIYVDSCLYSCVDFSKLESACGVHKTVFDQWVSERFS